MKKLKNLLFCIGGTIIYCLGVNLFIVPLNLYSGGFIGIAQLISPIVEKILPFSLNLNLQGLIYFVLNIPLFLIGIFKLGKRFIGRSILLIIFETIFLTFIPIPKTPIINELITSCIIGGCMEGLGIGLTFVGFASGGGTDILGLMLTKDFKFMTVGKTNIIINAVLYAICAYKFSIDVAIYSIIATIFCSLVIDKVHKQNRVVSVNILSEKYEEISDMIIKDLDRGVTILEGLGAYSKQNKKMIVSIMSEYELDLLKEHVDKIDSNAFIFIHPNIDVIGDFEKRLSK